MNKEIKKNREALIRRLYSTALNEQGKYYHIGVNPCLCPKGVCNTLMLTEEEYTSEYSLYNSILYDVVPKLFGMDLNLWNEMERRYEGWGGEKRSFSQIADWLQTLKGWPKIL